MADDDRLYSMRSRGGWFLAVQCPPWCTMAHSGDDLAEWAWHETPAIAFDGPGDYFDGVDAHQFEIMWACISAEPNDADGTYGTPYLCFDTLSSGLSARLDVAQADAVLRDLRQYVDRFQQMRDRLAAILDEGGEPR